jgi:2'-phosphotransferase
MNREVAVSKALSKLLRHAAEDAGLTLDGEGFARLDQVVRLPTFVLLPLLRE